MDTTPILFISASTVFAVVVLVSHSMTQVRDTAQTGCVLLPTIDLAEERHYRWRVMRNVHGKLTEDILIKLSSYSNRNLAA